MNLISFDPLRTWDVPGVRALKAAEWERHIDALRAADWILFPEYWQVNALVYGLQRPIFPSVSSYHLGHNKVEMTRAFQVTAPRCVPYTRILPRTETAVSPSQIYRVVRRRRDMRNLRRRQAAALGRSRQSRGLTPKAGRGVNMVYCSC
jgi:hypothetical protein